MAHVTKAWVAVLPLHLQQFSTLFWGTDDQHLWSVHTEWKRTQKQDRVRVRSVGTQSEHRASRPVQTERLPLRLRLNGTINFKGVIYIKRCQRKQSEMQTQTLCVSGLLSSQIRLKNTLIFCDEYSWATSYQNYVGNDWIAWVFVQVVNYMCSWLGTCVFTSMNGTIGMCMHVCGWLCVRLGMAPEVCVCPIRCMNVCNWLWHHVWVWRGGACIMDMYACTQVWDGRF